MLLELALTWILVSLWRLGLVASVARLGMDDLTAAKSFFDSSKRVHGV